MQSAGNTNNFKSVVAEIDLSAISHNCRMIRNLTNSAICAVVKSNAYGHGVETVLPALEKENVEMLAVATIEQSARLRELGWDKPILLLGSELSIYEDKAKDSAAMCLVENDIRITAMYPQDITVLGKAAEKSGKRAKVHIMLDTGMNRVGLDEKRLISLIEKITNTENVDIEGLYTHFAAADTKDKSFSYKQVEKFKSFVSLLDSKGQKPKILHLANSAGVLDLKDISFDMVRPGIAVYGYKPDTKMVSRCDLRMSLKLKTFLEVVKDIPEGSYVGYGCSYKARKDMTIGVAGIGYSDGYDRGLSNRGVMEISGIEVPVIGRVTMNQTILDITDLKDNGIKPCPGIEVVAIDNRRESGNNVEKTAEKLGTVPHEITARFAAHIKRIGVW